MSYCESAPGHPFHGPYHDTEYGFPVASDDVLFERLVLEINQAGLSWLTVLRKREAFLKAFRGFDVDKVARFNSRSVERLLADEGIIRNRAKVRSAINNAKRFREVRSEFGEFAAYAWSFVGGRPLRRGPYATWQEIPAETDESHAFSEDLKGRGFTFVGPTIIYAYMQAVGMVNDHTLGCFRRDEV